MILRIRTDPSVIFGGVKANSITGLVETVKEEMCFLTESREGDASMKQMTTNQALSLFRLAESLRTVGVNPKVKTAFRI